MAMEGKNMKIERRNKDEEFVVMEIEIECCETQAQRGRREWFKDRRFEFLAGI